MFDLGNVARWVSSKPELLWDGVSDIHFDELFGTGNFPSGPVDLVKFSSELVLVAASFIETDGKKKQIKYVSVFLPFNWSERGIKKSWNDKDWRLVEGVNEPPNLMLMDSQTFLGFAEEEYYKRLVLPVAGYSNVHALFRSWIGTFSDENDATTGIHVYVALPD